MNFVLPLFSSSLKDSMDSRDQIIASMLAQEGVEMVQNIRDTNVLKDGQDNVFKNNFAPNARSIGLRVDYNKSDLVWGNGFYKLRLDNNGYYVEADITRTTRVRFRRRIMVFYYDNSGNSVNKNLASKAVVTSVVSWDDEVPPLLTGDCDNKPKCKYATLVLTKWN